MNKGYDFGSSFSVIFEQIVHQTTKKDNTSFFKNFVFNLYSMFSEYFTWDLDKFGIDVWFNRLQNGNLFYDEIKYYNYNAPGFSLATGHFTQVVWKSSKSIGVGVAKGLGGTTYVVVNYYPQGNYQGQFSAKVPMFHDRCE